MATETICDDCERPVGDHYYRLSGKDLCRRCYDWRKQADAKKADAPPCREQP